MQVLRWARPSCRRVRVSNGGSCQKTPNACASRPVHAAERRPRWEPTGATRRSETSSNFDDGTRAPTACQKAERELGKLLDKVDRERWRQPSREQLSTLVTEFLDEYLPSRGRRRSTGLDYTNTLRRHVLPTIGDVELAELETRPERESLVFCHPQLGTPLDASKVSGYMRKAIIATGISRPIRAWHDLRHTALTHDAAVGNPAVYVQGPGRSCAGVDDGAVRARGAARVPRCGRPRRGTAVRGPRRLKRYKVRYKEGRPSPQAPFCFCRHAGTL